VRRRGLRVALRDEMRSHPICELALASLALFACGATEGERHDTGNADGGASASGDGSLPENCGALATVVRDFQAGFPDMKALDSTATGDDRGLVQPDLGSDQKPVYAGSGATLTVTGKATFDQWYRDVAGVSLPFDLPMTLIETPPGSGTYVYDNQMYFPIDGMGWGDPPIDGHNFYFTTEIHTTFHYFGGEQFTFVGDDDVFVFVNHKLAIDLGGVHSAETEAVDFDAQAGALGLTKGNVYALDIFQAERHPTGSTFRIETSISCLVIE
jgi:fibro-slime domain-containing protein